MSEELKPCPFCGSAAMLEELGDHHGLYHNLGCSIRECPAYHVIYTENEAPISESVAWWNRRAQPERKTVSQLVNETLAAGNGDAPRVDGWEPNAPQPKRKALSDDEIHGILLKNGYEAIAEDGFEDWYQFTKTQFIEIVRTLLAQASAQSDNSSQPAAATVPDEMTPEMMRAVQLKSELGAYVAANMSGAYALFSEFWRVAVKAAQAQDDGEKQ